LTSVTYNHGFLTDCDDITGWTENVSGMLAAEATLTSLYGDWFKIDATFNDAGDEYCWYTYDFTDNGLSDILSNSYTHYVIRWRTSESSIGAGARCTLVFSVGNQEILTSTPQFSTTWKVNTGTITAAKTITGVKFYADDYPNDASSNGDHSVYFDFLLLCKGKFTWPYVSDAIIFTPTPRVANIPIFGRLGDITQLGGSGLATARIMGTIDNRAGWKRAGDVIGGQVFYEIAHNKNSEPWQWLDTGDEQFKAVLKEPNLRRERDSKEQRVYDLLFQEYRLSSASNESYIERYGLNL